ncbi:endonuclease domain-containing protein [Methylosarcina fibrata]|uniref:endonuclease domain-containing protein n=1 Tax=Methylosarcina fibrata TaxID=105972 RepID=UPI000A0487E6|nr:endonuclease domain-containing protein [Methylosarcina fibrata]
MNTKYPSNPSTYCNRGGNSSSPSPRGERGWGEGASLLEHAKFLRSNQTEAEQRLWYYLRAGRFMELKFKRQKPIGPFIADFVCLELRLIIEADGSQHGDEQDEKRNAWFRANGFTILHFWNNDVLAQTAAVLEQIRMVAGNLSKAADENKKP